MSAPVSICLIARAARDEKYYGRLLERLRYNAEAGSFSFWDCPHDPKCKLPAMTETAELLNRLRADLTAAHQGPLNAMVDTLERMYAAPGSDVRRRRTDTLPPTHLAQRGEGTLPLPVAMLQCPHCENLFAVVALHPQNAPSCCCYCAGPLFFKEGQMGFTVKLNAGGGQ